MCQYKSSCTNTMDQLSQKVDNLCDPDKFIIKTCELYIINLALPKTPYFSNIVLYLGKILSQYSDMNFWRSFLCLSSATELLTQCPNTYIAKHAWIFSFKSTAQIVNA